MVAVFFGVEVVLKCFEVLKMPFGEGVIKCWS